MSLRQNLNLFLQRLARFWQFLALFATTMVFASFFGFTIRPTINFFDIDILSGVESETMGGVVGAITAVIIFTYMQDLELKKPTQPFKLRQLVFPKKFYSPKMWVTEAPYTAVFILFVVLWLVFYGWYFGQFNLSPREIFIAYLTLALLSAVYVLCVLAQGYRDFLKNQD